MLKTIHFSSNNKLTESCCGNNNEQIENDLDKVNCIECMKTEYFKWKAGNYRNYRKLNKLAYNKLICDPVKDKYRLMNNRKYFLAKNIQDENGVYIANHAWLEIPLSEDRKRWHNAAGNKIKFVFKAVRKSYNKKNHIAKKYSLNVTGSY